MATITSDGVIVRNAEGGDAEFTNNYYAIPRCRRYFEEDEIEEDDGNSEGQATSDDEFRDSDALPDDECGGHSAIINDEQSGAGASATMRHQRKCRLDEEEAPRTSKLQEVGNGEAGEKIRLLSNNKRFINRKQDYAQVNAKPAGNFFTRDYYVSRTSRSPSVVAATSLEMNGRPSISDYSKTNGHSVHMNGDVRRKSSHQELVVNYDLEDPQIPSSYYCCKKLQVQKFCRFVAVMSFFGVTINVILYLFGISRLGFNSYLEVFLLVFDFVAALCLLIGVSKSSSAMLKPYLFFNAIWSLGLFILFILCIWQIIKGNGELPRNIMSNLHGLKPSGERMEYRPRNIRQQGNSQVAVIVTSIIMCLYALVIIIDCLFLHVVYRTFQLFAYKEDKRREEERKDQI